jgi:hypothetical protein
MNGIEPNTNIIPKGSNKKKQTGYFVYSVASLLKTMMTGGKSSVISILTSDRIDSCLDLLY